MNLRRFSLSLLPAMAVPPGSARAAGRARLGSWTSWCACAAVVLAAAASAQAHPGHGFGDQGTLHYLTSPTHAAWLALAGAALWLGAGGLARSRFRRFTEGAGVLALIVALFMLGLRF